MFTSTLRKLTALISLVFLLIFIIFTSIFYGYISYNLFDKIDDAMRLQAGSFQFVNGRAQFPRPRPLFDPRIFLLLRSTEGQIVNISPFRIEENNYLAEIVPKTNIEEPETREYENHVYRIVAVPYRYENKLFNEEFVIREVIAISIVDPEVGLLNNLLWIIIGGLIVGMVSIIVASYFLARRAMIPIQAAWEKQQQFVADASHELRSPITGIYSNAELMLRHPQLTIQEQSHRINTIMKESSRMTKLIASLLTLARSDADKAELQVAPVDFSEMVEMVAEHFKPLEELNKVSLTVQIKPAIELMADRERLHQLVVILLDNAFKYTSEGGKILLSCDKDDKSAIVVVQDTGCGIAAEHLPHIFDRFFRGDKARSRDKGGTGLGLAIAKWIVEKHGGKIAVESSGKGTTFQVSLPIGKIRKDR
ncbi:phospho-acceptor domain-containing protein [Anaerospora hongkongensis]|uniref:histidine kinase n=1 Tax=Anaerospora hongkongensis TaxID=244830 RepID=A0A4R1PXU2_9FIRM|nr:HAMP domain-containing sensor histidine kinase [Anaerospora hongkongensis]TCL32709.1 phospho-acceptor domain-containing protein [Anaerospora hongkongensis]